MKEESPTPTEALDRDLRDVLAHCAANAYLAILTPRPTIGETVRALYPAWARPVLFDPPELEGWPMPRGMP